MKQTAKRRQELHPEKYVSDVMKYYMKAMIIIREVDRLGNISMDAQKEVHRINRQGKLTGYIC